MAIRHDLGVWYFILPSGCMFSAPFWIFPVSPHWFLRSSDWSIDWVRCDFCETCCGSQVGLHRNQRKPSKPWRRLFFCLARQELWCLSSYQHWRCFDFILQQSMAIQTDTWKISLNYILYNYITGFERIYFFILCLAWNSRNAFNLHIGLRFD